MAEPRIRNPLTSKHEVTLCETDETNSEDSRYKNNHRMYYIHVFCCPVNWLSESHPNTVCISAQQKQHQLTSVWEYAECLMVIHHCMWNKSTVQWWQEKDCRLHHEGDTWSWEDLTRTWNKSSKGWKIFVFELTFSTNKFKGAKHNFL